MNSEDKNNIINLLVHAENNKVNISEMISIIKMEIPPKGDIPGFFTYLSGGFKVVLTIEEHPGGWMRHVSVSKERAEPSKEETWEIISQLGFNKEEEHYAYTETGPGIESSNIIQLY